MNIITVLDTSFPEKYPYIKSKIIDTTEEDKKLKKEFLDLVGSLPQKIKVEK